MEELIERLRARATLPTVQTVRAPVVEQAEEGGRQARLYRNAWLQLQQECQFYGITNPITTRPDLASRHDFQPTNQQHLPVLDVQRQSDVPNPERVASNADGSVAIGDQDGDLASDMGNSSETISISSQDWQHLD